MFKFSIRDMLWLTVVVGLVLGWWLNNRQLNLELRQAKPWRTRAGALEHIVREYGWEVEWGSSEVGARWRRGPGEGLEFAFMSVPNEEYEPSVDDPWLLERTGFNELRFQPGSKLAHVLNDPTMLEFKEAPLREVLDYLQDLHGIKIEIDDQLAAKSFARKVPLITFKDDGMSLRSALAKMLEKANLRCEVRGDELYICLQ